MLVVLGASGYVGAAFASVLKSKGIEFVGFSRCDVDYSDVAIFTRYLKNKRPSFVINAAGYTGRPNVDACEKHKAECLFGNAVLPGRIAEACQTVGIPLGHVSSGCIYTGTRPDGSGFTEEDEPNFSFRQNNCSWYSGTKALGEDILRAYHDVYVWRLRIPFGANDERRNYLSKLLNYERILNATNSISNLQEFAVAAIACWERRVPYGIYNLTNPGTITAREITELLHEHGITRKAFHFFKDQAEFMRLAADTPRSNCILDSGKLSSVGIQMTPVRESIIECLKNWHSAKE